MSHCGLPTKVFPIDKLEGGPNAQRQFDERSSMTKILVLLCSFFVSTTSFAALLTVEGTSKKVEELNLSATATVKVEGEDMKLTSVGAGLRTKKVVFVKVKVYVGQLYVASPEIFKKYEAEALGSLKDQRAVAIQLHFLRDVDAENVQKSFSEALKANGVDVTQSSTKQFLEAVAKGGEANKAKSLSILGLRFKDGREGIFYESTNGKTYEIKGDAGFIERIFSIWLGKPADEGVADLRREILK